MATAFVVTQAKLLSPVVCTTIPGGLVDFHALCAIFGCKQHVFVRFWHAWVCFTISLPAVVPDMAFKH